MIDPDAIVFPNNAIDLIFIRLSAALDPIPDPINGNVQYFKRQLRPEDPQQSVGIFPIDWVPDESSTEMRGTGHLGISEPTLNRYHLGAQGLVKHSDETSGIRVHSVMSTRIRSILYRDSPLRIGLGGLQSTLDGYTERFKKLGVRSQRFISNEIDGVFTYLSVVEFWIETENV